MFCYLPVDMTLLKQLHSFADRIFEQFRLVGDQHRLLVDGSAALAFITDPSQLESTVKTWCRSLEHRNAMGYCVPNIPSGPFQGMGHLNAPSFIAKLRSSESAALQYALMVLQRMWMTPDNMPEELMLCFPLFFRRVLFLAKAFSESASDRTVVLSFCFYLAEDQDDIGVIFDELVELIKPGIGRILYFEDSRGNVPVRMAVELLENLFAHRYSSHLTNYRAFAVDFLRRISPSEIRSAIFNREQINMLFHAMGTIFDFNEPDPILLFSLEALLSKGADSSAFQWTRGKNLFELIDHDSALARKLRRAGCCHDARIPALRCLAASKVRIEDTVEPGPDFVPTDEEPLSLREIVQRHA